jgi:hypothetical protein
MVGSQLGPEDGAEPEESEEEEEVAPAAAPKKVCSLAHGGQFGDGDESGLKEAQSKKKKSKKKKSATATPKVEDEDDSAASPAASGPAKVVKGKKKGGGGTVQPAGDEEMDEVDKALAELKLKWVTLSLFEASWGPDKTGMARTLRGRQPVQAERRRHLPAPWCTGEERPTRCR